MIVQLHKYIIIYAAFLYDKTVEGSIKEGISALIGQPFYCKPKSSKVF